MLAGEVGEDSGGEGDAVEPSLVERMGRRFHCHVTNPSVDQATEGGLQIERARRGERPGRRVDAITGSVEGTKGADAADIAVLVEQVAHDGGCGRLAVGARDADKAQLRRGLPVPRLGDDLRRAAPVANHHDRHGSFTRLLGDQRRRAMLQRLRDEPVSVGDRSADRDEQGAGLHQPGVDLDAAEGDVRVRCVGNEVVVAERANQVLQGHGVESA